MRWLDNNGKLVYQSDNKYRIDWDKKSRSKQQFEIKQFLKKYCFFHVLFEEYPLPHTLLKVDFLDATLKLAIEHQGIGHNAYNSHFHSGRASGFLNSIKRDIKKREILERNGFRVIETFPEDLPLTKEFFLNKFGINL